MLGFGFGGIAAEPVYESGRVGSFVLHLSSRLLREAGSDRCPAKGRAATGEFLGRMATNVSTDYRFDNEQVLIDGELFALVWTMSGTNDLGDERAGVPATGRRFRVPGVSIGRLRDGKVVQQRDYWNMADFLSQVSLMPAPNRAAPATS